MTVTATLCPVHRLPVVYSEAVGMCLGCVGDLRRLLTDEDAEFRRAVEVRLAEYCCEHTTRVSGCMGSCWRFA